jgi:tetratricopeptide (TPR) repeat protein
MKSLAIKGVFALIIIMFAHSGVFGQRGDDQRGRFGETPEDSIRALRNLSLYTDRHRQGNFEDALPYWRVVFKEFPLITRNIYIHGENILAHMIENATSEAEKKAYLDTAMMMFDQRIEYYGDEANVLGRKGIFYFRHNNNIEEAGPGYEALGEAIKLSEDNPSPAVVITYMNVTLGKFQSGMIDNEAVINTYTYLAEILDNVLARSPNGQIENARESVETLFTGSGAADCDALIRIFGERVDQSPEDTELLNNVHDLLSNAGCTDSELYLGVTEKIHVLDPSVRSALNLSAMYRTLDNYDQVINYLEQAIDLQENPEERSTYYLELAILTNQVRKDKQLSRQYALRALEDNSSLGRAHIHIGSLYAVESDCFAGDPEAAFKNRTVYWVAVDRFNEAKRVDPALTAEANRLIETYSIYFPDMETIFFHGYTEGESYRVACWINETTRIRARRE